MKAIEQPFLVNLADTDTARYLKVKVELELENELMAEEVEKKLPQINDEIIMLLSSKTFEEVTTVAGKQALKQMMQRGINAKLKEGKVVNVYFTEFVVQ
jgi:flagellar FliL protein